MPRSGISARTMMDISGRASISHAGMACGQRLLTGSRRISTSAWSHSWIPLEAWEQLSDKVQYYDRETGILENALDRERRLHSLEAGSGAAEEDGQNELPNV